MIIIFDVDGTLLDTYPLVKASYIHTFDKLMPNYKYNEKLIRSFFGPPLPDTFRKATNNEALVNQLVHEYQKFSNENANKYLKTYPNVEKVLNQLKKEGHTLVVLSNKHSDAIAFEFKTVGIFNYFNDIFGYNDVINPKPNPEGIYKIQEKYGLDTIFVGDSIYDIETAKNANIKAIAVSWAQLPKSVGADYIINDFIELLRIIKGG